MVRHTNLCCASQHKINNMKHRKKRVINTTIYDLEHILDLVDENVATTRADKEEFRRVNWATHVEQQVNRRLWQGKYHMTPETFDKLVQELKPYIVVDSRRLGSHQPIYPEIVVGIGVRYLGGTKMTEFDEIYNVSYPSAWIFINHLQCIVLIMIWPTSQFL